MRYGIDIRNIRVDTNVYPADIILDVQVRNNVTGFRGFIVYTLQFVSYMYQVHFPTFELEFPEGNSDFQSRLTLPYELCHMMLAHMEAERRDEVVMTVVCRLHHYSINNDLATNDKQANLRKQTWKECLNRGSKPESVGLKQSPLETAHLANNLSRFNQAMTSSFEGKIWTGFINYMKQVILDDPTFKEIGKLTPLLSNANEVGLNSDWINAAVMLALQEIRIRQVLRTYYPSITLEGQNFEYLFKNFRKLLVENGISIDEKRFSRIKGEHDYRNKVIHEGVKPSNDEDLKEIAEDHYLLNNLIRELEYKRNHNRN